MRSSDGDLQDRLLQSAREAEGAAAVAYEYALDDRQSIANDDRAAVAEWFDRVARLGEEYARAQQRRMRLEGPSFVDVLRDPTTQMDRDGVVLASILTHQVCKHPNAKTHLPGTAGGSSVTACPDCGMYL